MVENSDRAQWLQLLPAIVDECAARWSLKIGEPFPKPRAGGVGWAAPAVRGDGTKVVLKVNFPHREAVHEADALALIEGDGAVLLLEAAPELDALLLERLEPGDPLWELPDEEGIPIAASILRRICKPLPAEHPFDRLADEAARWATNLEAPWDGLARDLAQSTDEQVLVQQDFHQGNILSAQREPWLAIDPKPLAGEREFGAVALLRDRSWEIDARAVRRRLDTLVEALEVDRERMWAWGVVHALAWDNVPEAELIASVRPESD
jgi:streptomycin 6-kinase